MILEDFTSRSFFSHVIYVHLICTKSYSLIFPSSAPAPRSSLRKASLETYKSTCIVSSLHQPVNPSLYHDPPLSLSLNAVPFIHSSIIISCVHLLRHRQNRRDCCANVISRVVQMMHAFHVLEDEHAVRNGSVPNLRHR